MTSCQVEYAGRWLTCHESESRVGPPVILCHGSSSSAQTFAALLEGRLGRERRLIALDFPGHGQSADLSDPAGYSIVELGRVVLTVIGALRLERYVLVGHSLGGHVLSEALPRLSGALGLFLVSAPPLEPSLLPSIFRPDPSQGAMFEGSLGRERALLFARQLAPEDRVGPRAFAALRRSIERTDSRFRPALRESLQRGEFGGEAHAVANARVPVAICYGLDDPFLYPASHASVSLPTLWRGRPWALENCGHSPHLEQPERFQAVLSDFLSDLSGPVQR